MLLQLVRALRPSTPKPLLGDPDFAKAQKDGDRKRPFRGLLH